MKVFFEEVLEDLCERGPRVGFYITTKHNEVVGIPYVVLGGFDFWCFKVSMYYVLYVTYECFGVSGWDYWWGWEWDVNFCVILFDVLCVV